MLHSCLAVVPAFASDAYYVNKGSSSIGASLISGVPLVSHRYMLKSYKCVRLRGPVRVVGCARKALPDAGRLGRSEAPLLLMHIPVRSSPPAPRACCAAASWRRARSTWRMSP